MWPSSFLQRISVPVSNAKLIGDWLENRQGTPNDPPDLPNQNPNIFVNFLCVRVPLVMAQGASVRHYIGQPISPSAKRQCSPDTLRQ
jgi:hypothetical protein